MTKHAIYAKPVPICFPDSHFPRLSIIYPAMLKSPFDPCIPTKAATVPDRPEWIHEIKHDGYRLIIQRDGKRVRLWTRNGHDWR